ncbi:endonuclease/exonuclease/phosphatase family protein [Frigoriglobus tundricola]|uniref:endonuclease/exonuclease/phosphatase family protein n=1 Tax=Frigoriglobus tundricola TaxID=2774151 RepID=UPI00148EC0B0|nr:endonuclease/exonuclease/phosphatase family protein [Frigoriglobus tundricola]
MTSAGASVLFAFWAVGQFVRDATWATGLCFYIPSPCVALVLFVMAGAHAAARRLQPALLALGCAVPPVVFTAIIENRFGCAPAGPPGALRLVHWNTAGRPGRPGVGEYLIAERADLYALTDVANAAHVGVLRDMLASDYGAVTFGNLAVVGRGDIRANGWLVTRDGFEVQAVTWNPPGHKPISVFVIDMPSDVRLARDPLLRELNVLIDRHRPDLVVGDFNAPRRSRALADLPTDYRHAYQTAGSGWGYTWPVPVPVYALDHCLYGPRIAPGRYQLGGLDGASDHRYQVFDFSLTDE